MQRKHLLAASLAAVTIAFAGYGFTEQCHTVQFINTDGKAIGQAELTQTPNGVLIKANASSLPEGWHAFHIHETGQCNPPDFQSAGGHYNPLGKSHGFEVPTGAHAGDLPNVYIGADGKLNMQFLTREITLDAGPNTVFDENGSALVIHAGVDDYASQPSGDAGGRIACAVIK